MSDNQSKTQKRKRSARGSGTLYKRDVTGKEHPADWKGRGSFYLAYTMPSNSGNRGKRIRQALKDTDGKPITDRKQAEAERKRIMAPYQAGSEVEALQAVKARIDNAETKQRAAEAKANPPPELDSIWKLFLESPARPDSGESTLKQYHAEWKRFRSWLNEHHNNISCLHQITRSMAQEYAKNLVGAKLSASTFNQHRNLLLMVWRVLEDECHLKDNPWDRIKRRKLTSLATRKRALTAAQFENLLAATKGNTDLKDLFTLLAWTGLRLADGVLLKWGCVDFSQHVISLAPMKTARRQGKLVYIPIFPVAEEVLNRRQAEKVLNPRGLVFPKLAAKYKRDSSALSKDITAVFEEAGLQTTETRADRGRAVVVYGAHSLRHFFVTAATSAGLPTAMIKSITGHATDDMLEHYQQIGIDLAAEMAQRVQGVKPKEIPNSNGAPSPPPIQELQRQINDIAKGITSKSWKDAKKELLTLAAELETDSQAL